MSGVCKSCMTCGGLIPEPGKAYGYAGPVCHCLRQQAVCVPFPGTNQLGGVSLGSQLDLQSTTLLFEKLDKIITLLRSMEASLDGLIERGNNN